MRISGGPLARCEAGRVEPRDCVLDLASECNPGLQEIWTGLPGRIFPTRMGLTNEWGCGQDDNRRPARKRAPRRISIGLRSHVPARRAALALEGRSAAHDHPADMGRHTINRGRRSLWRYGASLPIAVADPVSLGEWPDAARLRVMYGKHPPDGRRS
jgi:hypothetical protein